MSPGNLAWLYEHPTMKALINIGHGEGYGLPLFEAAYHGLPLITTTWSGQMDFICKPNKKGKQVPRVIKVDYDVKQVQKEAVWDGIIQADSKWAYAKKKYYISALRDCLGKEVHWRKEAEALKNYIRENFTKENLYKQFIQSLHIPDTLQDVDYVFVSDLFKEQYIGGAELSLQALIDSAPTGAHVKFNSANLTTGIVDTFKDATWIFGNISQIPSSDILRHVIDAGIKYHFIEFDYKFCEYRNPGLYQVLEDEVCNYSETDQGKLITEFVNNSIMTHFMSEGQLEVYQTSLSGLNTAKTTVLSSIFDDEFFENIDSLLAADPVKTDAHVVLGSRSWVKGFADSEKWCKENGLEYQVISDLPHAEVLDRLSTAKGIVFKPAGLDTCPRYVIEAKLLGCDLELNENVQHLNEEWFNTDDVNSILSYLRSRREVFWDSVTKNG